MAQKRFNNFKDPVDSFEQSEQLNGILPPGRYSGFDAILDTGAPGPGVTIQVNHLTTGFPKTIENGSVENNVGICKTPNGTIVHENATLPSLQVGSNSANAFDRIDLLIVDHTYVALAGGQAATYSIVQGPLGGPVAPALPNPATQTILGTFYIDASSDAIGNIAYTPADVPMLGAEDYATFIAKLDIQTVTQAAIDHAALQAQITANSFPDTLYFDPTGAQTPVLFVDTPGSKIEVQMHAHFRDDATFHQQLFFENGSGSQGVMDADVNDDLRIQAINNATAFYGGMKFFNPIPELSWTVTSLTSDRWVSDFLGATSGSSVWLPAVNYDRWISAFSGGGGASGHRLHLETFPGSGVDYWAAAAGRNSGFDGLYFFIPANCRFKLFCEFTSGNSTQTFYIWKFGL